MNNEATIQEWVTGFEKFMQEKFQRKIYLLALSDDSVRLDMSSIARIVCSVANISLESLFSESRVREIANARHITMMLCYQYTSYSLHAIGKHFGGRDHTTVIHARKTVNERLFVKDKLTTLVFTKSERIIKTLISEEGTAK